MKKFLLLGILSVTSLFGCHTTSDCDEVIANDYSRTWFLVNTGQFDEAKEEMSEINVISDEELIHQELIKLYIAIRQRRYSEMKMLMKAVDRFSSDVYSTY